MESAESEPIMGVWGGALSRGPGAEPVVRRLGAKKLKAFLLLDVS